MSTFEWGSDTWGQPGHNVHVSDSASHLTPAEPQQEAS